jgi:signal transduction histidine kinase
VAAAIFAGTYTGQRIGGLAARVQHLESAISSATHARVYLAQAVSLSDEPQALLTTDAALDAAESALGRLTIEVGSYRDLTPARHPELMNALDVFTTEAAGVMDLMGADDSLPAMRRVAAGLDPSLEKLLDELGDRQRADAAEVNSATRTLGNLTSAVRFLVVFAIPALAMTAYRWMMQRQRRKAEMEIRIAAERRINKAKDEFIANVSHELRTPLTGIVGFAQLLQESALTPQDSEIVRTIVGESAELSRMVDDLLTAARVDADALSIELEEVDIVQQVQEVAVFMELFGTRLAVQCEPAKVQADPERLRQIFRNLTVNARRYGGPNVRIVGRERGDRYLCAVVDDGHGIPSDVEERLFSRFVHQGSAPLLKGSVGLGLAIVHELAHRMGCDVTYRRIRKETWFTVSIPVTQHRDSSRVLVSALQSQP